MKHSCSWRNTIIRQQQVTKDKMKLLNSVHMKLSITNRSLLTYPLTIVLGLMLSSCNSHDDEFDASGSFEAEETIIAAEASGTIQQFDVEEGQVLKAGQVLGFIDSTQLYLKRRQLESQIKSTLSQKPNINTQIAALQVQLKSTEREQQRVSNLLKAGAATQKQMDDMNAQVDMLKRQLDAQRSSLGITSGSITEQTSPLKIQIEQTQDQLSKCRIINPVNGTVLTKYAEPKEMASPGKPLYKIADLSTIILRAYITGDQLVKVKLNQKVKVLVDDGPDKYKTYEGIVTWISDKAEFTPKTIQTKEERANLVYASKIKVKNDGLLKLGMYAEVKF
jgi:HlyD family secretion protein